MVRLTWRDGLATLAVIAAVVVFVLWAAETTSMSIRATGAIVFALGWVGCLSDRAPMMEVYGAAEQQASVTYALVTSVVGATALVAGVLTLIFASEPMLITLVVATVVLWVAATARHATTHAAPGAPA